MIIERINSSALGIRGGVASVNRVTENDKRREPRTKTDYSRNVLKSPRRDTSNYPNIRIELRQRPIVGNPAVGVVHDWGGAPCSFIPMPDEIIRRVNDPAINDQRSDLEDRFARPLAL